MHTILSAVLAALVAYMLKTLIYHVAFDPLRRIPGPFLSAYSYLPEMYYDIWKRGKYIWEIDKMHNKYGPIVRINPREIHIRDPAYFETIYAGGSRPRDKDWMQVRGLDSPLASIATVSHNHHRLRRSLIDQHFSRKTVLKLESFLHAKIDNLIRNFRLSHERSEHIVVNSQISALTADIVTQYCFGAGSNYLDHGNEINDMQSALTGTEEFLHVTKFFPVLAKIAHVFPEKVVRMLSPPAAGLMNMQRKIHELCIKGLNDDSDSRSGQSTIFGSLTSENVPAAEKTAKRIASETWIITAAGTETTSRALSVGLFHLLEQPRKFAALRNELMGVMPEPDTIPSLISLEKLDYLTGVVYEALRLSGGASNRSPRVPTSEVLEYNGLFIPPGTSISQAAWFVHMDESIFPDPEAFKPERWNTNGDAAERSKLFRRLVVFSKGTRACVGMNLALAEMFLTLARVVRKFDMALYNTTIDNIRFDRDMGIPFPEEGLFSVQACVKGIATA
ncbi:hypothetical protein Q7P37_006475 [Cladosporium fusiforme]